MGEGRLHKGGAFDSKGWLSAYYVDITEGHFREWEHEYKQGGGKIQVLIHLTINY